MNRRNYLEKMRQILKEQAVVGVIFPYVETKNQSYSLNKLIDKLKTLGYTLLFEPVLYSREQAIVRRQIIFFKYSSHSEEINKSGT